MAGEIREKAEITPSKTENEGRYPLFVTKLKEQFCFCHLVHASSTVKTIAVAKQIARIGGSRKQMLA